MNLSIRLEGFQRRFVSSRARFPCFAASWATGKTMCGLLKGILLSLAYKNNLGVVIRRVYKDLRDSTMQDFKRYTGLEVPESTADVEVPGGSHILFRHGKDLSTLQNVNLGWAYIEQGEEFVTSDEFNMVRGRLRRELEFNPEFKARQAGLAVAIPELFELLTTERVRQCMVIANKNGHNWIWHDWLKCPVSSEFELHEAKTADNARNLPKDYLNDVMSMKDGSETSKRKWRIYVDNSWEETDAEGAYYGTLIGDLRRGGRICPLEWFPGAPVYTFWDVGVSDSTAIWFVQFINGEVRVIDYYEESGKGLAHYAKVLQDKGYVYGGHFGPHDIQQRDKATAVKYITYAKSLGIDFTTIERHRVEDRIEAARECLPNCRIFDKLTYGVEVLEHYQRKKNEVLSSESRPTYSDEPLHDWSSHGADAFGYMAYQWRWGQIGGQYIGSSELIAAFVRGRRGQPRRKDALGRVLTSRRRNR